METSERIDVAFDETLVLKLRGQASLEISKVQMRDPQKKPSALFYSYWSQDTSLGEISLAIARALQESGWDVGVGGYGEQVRGGHGDLLEEELGKFDEVENPDVFFFHQKASVELESESYGKSIFQMPCDASLLSKEMVASANKADLVITPSSHSESVMIESGVKTPIRIIPNWVDTTVFNLDTPRYDYDFPGVVVFVSGYFHRKKGLDILIPAFLEEFEGDDVLLVIKNSPVKGLEEYDRFLQENATGLKQIRYICEFVPKEQYASMVAGSDIVVSASRYEGFGIPLLEGLACGKSVVAPRFSGPLDFLDDSNSFLYDIEGMEEIPSMSLGPWFAPGSEWAIPSREGLKEALRRAVEEGVKENRRRSGLKTVQKYRKELVLKQYVDLFGELVE